MVTLSSHLSALTALIQHVRRSREWAVVVAPSGGPETTLQAALTMIRPSDGEMVGRTLLLPGGGRVSVSGSMSGIAGKGFLLMLVGFEGVASPRDEIAVHTWRMQASGILSVGDATNSLRVTRQ